MEDKLREIVYRNWKNGDEVGLYTEVSELINAQKDVKGENWRKGYQQGYDDAKKELENCPQCVGLREEFKEELRQKIETMCKDDISKKDILEKLLITNKHE